MAAEHAFGTIHRACLDSRRAGAEHGIPIMIGQQSAGLPWVKADADTTSEECSP
jgi:hypothetical protein